MASIDDVLARAKPRAETVQVCLRGDLLAEHERAEERLLALERQHAADDEVLAAAEAVAEVEADIAEHSVEFSFQSIGRAAWTRLLAEHPPTDEHAKAHPRVDHNPETFPYAAIAASCVAPEGVTVEKLHDLEEVLPVSTWDRLWTAVLIVNLGGRAPGESRAASAVLQRLRPSSEQPSDSASGEASSSDAP